MIFFTQRNDNVHTGYLTEGLKTLSLHPFRSAHYLPDPNHLGAGKRVRLSTTRWQYIQSPWFVFDLIGCLPLEVACYVAWGPATLLTAPYYRYMGILRLRYFSRCTLFRHVWDGRWVRDLQRTSSPIFHLLRLLNLLSLIAYVLGSRLEGIPWSRSPAISIRTHDRQPLRLPIASLCALWERLGVHA
jgi:hypothetical protein